MKRPNTRRMIMELMQAIETRRSFRKYRPDTVGDDKIRRLLHAAVQAPTGMNDQPWAFGIIEGQEVLGKYNERVKAFLLSKVDEWPWLAGFQERFRDRQYNVFHGAPVLIVIYAKNDSSVSQIDCCLAAENLMLAACDMGLGTCWIGLASWTLNEVETKRELGVPEEYVAIAPIIVGYPDGEAPPRERKGPEVLYRVPVRETRQV